MRRTQEVPLLDLVPHRLAQRGGGPDRLGDRWVRSPQATLEGITAIRSRGTGGGDTADGGSARLRGTPLRDGQIERGVAHGPGDDALGDDVDRQAFHIAHVHDAAPGGFQSDQAAAGGQDADRAATVVGVGQRGDTGSHQRRRTTGRTAGQRVRSHGLRVAPLSRLGGRGHPGNSGHRGLSQRGRAER